MPIIIEISTIIGFIEKASYITSIKYNLKSEFIIIRNDNNKIEIVRQIITKIKTILFEIFFWENQITVQ